MTRLWFLMPVHGREALTAVCLRQLKRTCTALAPRLDATAVVVGEGPSIDLAETLGFATVRRENRFLGRKFNDGFQLACDPAFNPAPADYVVPVGSDDWLDPAIFRKLPDTRHIGVFRQLAVVNEQRTKLSRLTVGYKGGVGVRIIPRQLLATAGYRPADEDRERAIDTSSLTGLKRGLGGLMPPMVELDVHPLQIVDIKTRGNQLNTYSAVRGFRRGAETSDPFGELATLFPEAVRELLQLETLGAAA